MSDRFVSKNDLDHLKQSCDSSIFELREAIKKYCDNVEEINTVISNLRTFYNTTGGKYKIKEIENIDILGNSFNEIKGWIDQIDINYSTYIDKY